MIRIFESSNIFEYSSIPLRFLKYSCILVMRGVQGGKWISAAKAGRGGQRPAEAGRGGLRPADTRLVIHLYYCYNTAMMQLYFEASNQWVPSRVLEYSIRGLEYSIKISRIFVYSSNEGGVQGGEVDLGGRGGQRRADGARHSPCNTAILLL